MMPGNGVMMPNAFPRPPLPHNRGGCVGPHQPQILMGNGNGGLGPMIPSGPRGVPGILTQRGALPSRGGGVGGGPGNFNRGGVVGGPMRGSSNNIARNMRTNPY